MAFQTSLWNDETLVWPNLVSSGFSNKSWILCHRMAVLEARSRVEIRPHQRQVTASAWGSFPLAAAKGKVVQLSRGRFSPDLSVWAPAAPFSEMPSCSLCTRQNAISCEWSRTLPTSPLQGDLHQQNSSPVLGPSQRGSVNKQEKQKKKRFGEQVREFSRSVHVAYERGFLSSSYRESRKEGHHVFMTFSLNAKN